jgi:hypothetical protein
MNPRENEPPLLVVIRCAKYGNKAFKSSSPFSFSHRIDSASFASRKIELIELLSVGIRMTSNRGHFIPEQDLPSQESWGQPLTDCDEESQITE